MQLDVYNTHVELYPYQKDDIISLEKLFTATDKFSQQEVPCGYMILDKKLYMPRGVPISKVEYMTGCSVKYIQESDPSTKMSDQFESLYEPRNDLQREAIKFLSEEKNHQLSFNAAAGFGKSFCVAYASTVVNDKTMIIVPNEGLKIQWINTYHKMFNYKPRHLMNIAGSKIIEDIMDDLIEERDVYFVNHATLRSYMTEHGGYALHKFFKKIKIGVKVYDESHLDFYNIMNIDNFTNTNRTWYLTATFDRSDRTESVCFKRAFSNVLCFGEMESKELMPKHVLYHIVDFKSRPTIQQRRQVMSWRGMTAATYGKFAFLDDENETAYRVIYRILELTNDLEGKTLIFVPLIDAVDKVVQKLKKSDLGKSVAAYHSKTSAEDKRDALKKDIIVSTIQSFGTGRDLPELRVLISATPLASRVQAEQLVGRLRPYAPGKDTYMFDLLDRQFPGVTYFHRARYKKIETLVKKTIYLNLDE